jgi:TPR repeat protein
MDYDARDEMLRIAFAAEAAGDVTTAIRLFKQASRRGSTDARSKLGTIFGDLVNPPQHRKVVYWYKRGVADGDSTCAWNLAMHFAGIGRMREYLRWLKIAVEMGDPDAALEIKSMHWWKKRKEQSRSTL